MQCSLLEPGVGSERDGKIEDPGPQQPPVPNAALGIEGGPADARVLGTLRGKHLRASLLDGGVQDVLVGSEVSGEVRRQSLEIVRRNFQKIPKESERLLDVPVFAMQGERDRHATAMARIVHDLSR